jgi:hypothetical protein
MTPQEIFDKVATHLLTQNKRSIGFDGSVKCCRYRALDGSRCAVGCLIPDNEYSETMEGARVRKLTGVLDRLELRAHVDLLAHLQATHDSYEPCQWRDNLRLVAIKHGLNTSVVEAFGK